MPPFLKKKYLPFLLIFLVLLLTPLAIKFNPLKPHPWPKGTISYYNDSDYNKTLLAAIQSWEDTGIDITFKETLNEKEADLLITDDIDLLREKCESCPGYASIGYTFGLKRSRMFLHPPINQKEDEIQDFHMLPTVIHELGHILGLNHNNDPCSVMNSNSTCRLIAKKKITPEGSFMFCGPWEKDADDVRELYQATEYDKSNSICHDPKASREYFFKEEEERINQLIALVKNTVLARKERLNHFIKKPNFQEKEDSFKNN